MQCVYPAIANCSCGRCDSQPPPATLKIPLDDLDQNLSSFGKQRSTSCFPVPSAWCIACQPTPNRSRDMFQASYSGFDALF